MTTPSNLGQIVADAWERVMSDEGAWFVVETKDGRRFVTFSESSGFKTLEVLVRYRTRYQTAHFEWTTEKVTLHGQTLHVLRQRRGRSESRLSVVPSQFHLLGLWTPDTPKRYDPLMKYLEGPI